MLKVKLLPFFKEQQQQCEKDSCGLSEAEMTWDDSSYAK